MNSKFFAKTTYFLAGIGAAAVLFMIWSFNASESTATAAKTTSDFQGNYKVFALPTPSSAVFAGEDVPIDIIDVREKLDREMLVNTYWHSNTFLMMKRANRWFPVIEPILKVNGIPEDFKYLALIESGLTNAVSPAGATGFWQFMQSTGKSYGLEINDEIDERYHVEKATVAACQYLREAYEKYGSWALVAASYNMGRAGLSRRLDAQQVNSYWDLLLNEETARYVYRIMAVKEIMSDPEKYGFMIGAEDLYAPYNCKTVIVDSAVTSFSDFALNQNINYKILKTLNPWLRKPQLSNRSGKTYEIKVPVDTSFRAGQ